MTDREKIQNTFSHLHTSEDTLREVTKMINKSRKSNIFSRRLTAVAAVVVLMVALGITAYATGFAESIIMQMTEAYALPDAERDEFYEKAGELSAKDDVTTQLSEFDSSSITLSESYYDGEELVMAYALDSIKYPIEYGFGPEHEYFDDLWTPGENYSNCAESLLANDIITTEEYNQIMEKFREDGEVGFVVRYIYLGDHIKMADGTDIGPVNGMEIDGNVVLTCQNGLPEAAKGLDKLDLVFKVKLAEAYCYMDDTGSYRYYPQTEYEEVAFTIDNCAK